jgi:hypothetical protein
MSTIWIGLLEDLIILWMLKPATDGMYYFCFYIVYSGSDFNTDEFKLMLITSTLLAMLFLV